MTNFWNKPKSLYDLADEIANRINSFQYPNQSDGAARQQGCGRDVSNEPRVPKGQSGGGEWTTDGSSTAKGSSRRLANSHVPALFVDDHGNPVLDKNGKPMQRPSDVDLRFFVDQGHAAADADTRAAVSGLMTLGPLPNFQRGGPWDIQRVGSDIQSTKSFIDAANVAIGLYGAAAGLPQEAVLDIANQQAKSSNFGPNATMDSTYTHLRQENVYDIQEGYRLYESGRIGSSPRK